MITEIGGTVGDIESEPFMEAIRQVKKDVGRNDVLYIHVTLVPYIAAAGELKTKPTQHSVKELRSIGITPDILVCRSEKEISKEMREKISMFCDVDADAVFQSITAPSIYEVPMLLEDQGMDKVVLRKLDMEDKPKDMDAWHAMVKKILAPHAQKSTIAVVGKYVELPDAYISIVEALKHASYFHDADVDIEYINAVDLEDPKADFAQIFKGVDGILVPGGFGDRGIEGMIRAAQYARETDPLLRHLPGDAVPGHRICPERLRHGQGPTPRNSTKHPVSGNLSDAGTDERGNQGRLPCGWGLIPASCIPAPWRKRPTALKASANGTVTANEVNNELRDELFSHGLVLGGTLPNGKLVEMVELPTDVHPWYLGAQFHPELKSRPTNPHPLFKAFIAAALKYHNH